MNVFVLNPGRCGSTTFIKACQHITNYSAAHESRVNLVGAQRLAYPDRHIEADNRLSWLLGRLDTLYGDNAFYVYLGRELEDAVSSFSKRIDFGIMKAYREGILMDANAPAEVIARDYLDTVHGNIRFFLRDKTNQMQFCLENAKTDFKNFWRCIGAEGELAAAIAEWDTAYNASE
jgi:hypothetical protein